MSSSKSTFSVRAYDAGDYNDLYHASTREMNDSSGGYTFRLDTDLNDAGKMTENDKFDMTRMGKKQELRRVFRQFSILSFTCVIMATWEFLLTANYQGLAAGGLSGLFWSYLWTFCGFGLIIASMAVSSPGVWSDVYLD